MQGGDDMKRIVVCDDEPESLKQTESFLNEYFADKKNIAEVLYYSSGEKMLEDDAKMHINSNEDTKSCEGREQIDIAILDVEMDKLSGIQTGHEIHKRYPEAILIITTAYMQYLDDAMDLRVFRYFEKPVEKERLFRALDISLRKKSVLSVLLKKGKIMLREDEIVCVSVNLRKTDVFLSNGEMLSTAISIKEWYKILEGNDLFGSPHKSYIVNFNYIRSFGNNYVIVECKTGKQLKIETSRRKYPDFKRAFNEKMREYK